MTRLVWALAFICLVAFCVAWWPGALLLAGLGLLWIAVVRADNERKAVRR